MSVFEFYVSLNLSSFTINIKRFDFVIPLQHRAMKVAAFLKWTGLIFGGIGILISGTLFLLLLKSMPMKQIPPAPSSGTKIDVQSIEK